MSKISKTTTTIVSTDTGEVQKSISVGTFTNYNKEDSFVKIYIDDIMKLINLPKKTGDIFFLLLEYIGYNNQVVINSSIKRIISDKLNIKFDTVNKAITVLNANGLLIRQDTGIYLVNPYYVGKGSWNDITKLRITCEYSKELGREIKYEQEY